MEAVAQRLEDADLPLEPQPLEGTLLLHRLQKLGPTGENVVQPGGCPVGQQGVEGPQGRWLHPHRQVVGDPAEERRAEGGHRARPLGTQPRGDLATGGIDAALEVDQLTLLQLAQTGGLNHGPFGHQGRDHIGLGHPSPRVGRTGRQGVEQSPLHGAIELGQAAGARRRLAEGGLEELTHTAEQLVDGVGGLLLQAGVEGLQGRGLHIGGKNPLQTLESGLPEIGHRTGPLAGQPMGQHPTGLIDMLLQCLDLGVVETALPGGVEQELLGGVSHADVDERGLRSGRVALDPLLDRAEHVELTLGGELREDALRHVHLRVSKHNQADARGTL